MAKTEIQYSEEQKDEIMLALVSEMANYLTGPHDFVIRVLPDGTAFVDTGNLELAVLSYDENAALRADVAVNNTESTTCLYRGDLDNWLKDVAKRINRGTAAYIARANSNKVMRIAEPHFFNKQARRLLRSLNSP